MRHWALLHWFLLMVFCNACGGSPALVSGPFGGATYRFRVDGMTLPFAADDGSTPFTEDFGDGKQRNQLEVIDSILQQEKLQSASVGAQLAAGSIDMRVELVSEDAQLQNDASVGVRFLGGAQAVGDQLGATLRNGKLATNRIRDLRAPSLSSISLPLLAGADAVEWPMEALEIDLTADGKGGFDGVLHGAAATSGGGIEALIGAAYPSFVQMVTSFPGAEEWAIHNFDTNRDGQISLAELADDVFVQVAVAPDVQLHDAAGHFAPPGPDGVTKHDALSIGLAFHLSRCADAACSPPAVAARCDDRRLDGDESATDCGGSCAPCASGLACVTDGDCQSGACRTGFCAPATCSDGRRDGFETDVDCGPGCGPCAAGQHCFDYSDCAAGAMCTNSICAPSLT